MNYTSNLAMLLPLPFQGERARVRGPFAYPTVLSVKVSFHFDSTAGFSFDIENTQGKESANRRMNCKPFPPSS